MALGIPSYRPPASGVTHVVSSGHQLAAQAGFRILEEGGNAIDAGVASGIAINTVLPQYTSFGGVAPIILHHAAKNETVTISGLGGWPKAASIELFRQRYGGDMPNGIMRTVVPSAVDAWLTALRLYGTMSFEQIVTPSLEIAEKGYPIPYTLHEALAGTLDYLSADMDAMDGWTGTSGLFFPNGKALNTGDVLIQQDLANTFQRMIDVERHANHLGREGAIQAARDLFYTGDIAEDMVRFCQEQGGLLTMEDLASFKVQVEAPAAGSYKGIDVLTCGPWCQGPVVIQALQMLEAVDLASMEYNGADYTHHVVEALKLAYSDRHAYYGDPDFVDVPMAGLMSKEYAGVRSQAIDPRSAFPGMPEPGDPRRMRTYRDVPQGELVATGDGGDGDTSYTCVIDRWGNAFSATPSDTLPTSPIVPGPWLHPVLPWLPVVARRRPSIFACAGQAPPPYAQPSHGHARREALDDLRHTWRRCAVPVDGAALPQRSGTRYGPAAGSGSPPVCYLELPQLLLAPHLQASHGGRRRAHPC